MERTKFGKLVKRKLIELDLTQRELAKRAGVSEAVMSRWVTGERTPGLRRAMSILKALDMKQIDIDELI